jgi:hypothetical protein
LDFGLKTGHPLQIDSTDTTDSTTTGTGAFITAGGVGIAKNAYVGANLRVIGTTEATNVATGSTVLSGGLGVAKNVFIGGDLYAPKVGVTTITDAQSPYTVLATDSYIGVDNGVSTVTVNLPAGTAGRKVTIYDYAGTASQGTITIDADGAEEINGAGTTTLTTDYQSVTLLFTGGNWTII